jgi:hypothetical protein
MSLSVEGIPQRESHKDKRREKLQEDMRKKGEDPTLLPATPATVIAYGRIGGGKSSIMYSWLKNMFPNYYDEVIIFSGSNDSREAYEALPQKKVVFMDDYDDEAFSKYIEKLKEDQNKREKHKEVPLNIFIGFDDIIFSEAISSRGKPTMAEKVMLISRHELNATVFICVQHSKQITPAMRNNTMYNIILPVQKNDLNKIAEEHAGHLSTDEFIRMYYNIMSKGLHEFIVVDYKAPEERRFRHKWDKIITFGKDERRSKPSPEEETGPSVRGTTEPIGEKPPSKKLDGSKTPDPAPGERTPGTLKSDGDRKRKTDKGSD